MPVTRVEDVTGSPEMLDERVKTLHPKIHGGLLADLGKDSHRADLEQHGIEPFDLVVSNLYPFLERPDIDTIDIGGPAMVRAAAKNHAWVTIVTSPAQYDPLLEELHANDGTVSEETRRALALEAFAHTAAYDAAIVQWLQEDELLPQHLMLALERTDETLRYGENPHQQAAAVPAARHDELVGLRARSTAVSRSRTSTSTTPTRHGGSCTISVTVPRAPSSSTRTRAASRSDPNLADAYQRALECDERSAFGGIVALNRPIDAATVERMVAGPQADVVIAPGYEAGDDRGAAAEAQEHAHPRSRAARRGSASTSARSPAGSSCRTPHHFASSRNDWRVVTKVAPTAEQWADLELAWRICGHVKSNAIVLVKDGQAVGIGAGQQNRVESGEIAAKKAAGRARGGASASDAFYPFEDGIEAAAACRRRGGDPAGWRACATTR